MKCVYRLMTTLFVLGLLASCDESGKIRVDRVEPAEGRRGRAVNDVGCSPSRRRIASSVHSTTEWKR